MNNPEYEAALAAHHAAFDIFDAVRTAYRAMQIGDAEFLAARAVYAAATAEFDIAYAAERDAETPAAAIAEENNQLTLF